VRACARGGGGRRPRGAARRRYCDLAESARPRAAEVLQSPRAGSSWQSLRAAEVLRMEDDFEMHLRVSASRKAGRILKKLLTAVRVGCHGPGA
jgi:hypothetical protein